MGKKSYININVKTHSIGGGTASLDVITGGGEPVNLFFKDVIYPKFWANEYIKVVYVGTKVGWQISAITPCLYNGQVYNSGDVIATWRYNETKDITIIVNI